MLNVIDVLFRVKTEKEELMKLQKGLINTSTKHKLLVRNMQDDIRVQKEYLRGLKALGGSFKDISAAEDELVNMVSNLKKVKDKYDVNSASIRKNTLKQRENVKELTRFKGEWLSVMFVAQAAAQPFMDVLGAVLKLTGVFDVLGALFTLILMPVLLPFTNLIIKLSGWIMKNKDTVGKFIAFLVILGAAFFGIIAVVGMVILAVTGIAAAIEGATVGMVILVVGAIAAVLAAIIVWGKDMWNNITDFFKAIGLFIGWVWDGAKERTRKFIDGVVYFFSSMKDKILDFLKPITDWFDNLNIGERLSNIGSGISNWWNNLVNGKEQFGGDIKQSGMYYLHAGEEVISNSPAGSQGGTFNNISISDVNVSDNIDIDLLARRVGNKLGRGI